MKHKILRGPGIIMQSNLSENMETRVDADFSGVGAGLVPLDKEKPRTLSFERITGFSFPVRKEAG